ncbi:unnamed protein product [Brassica oleracea var. botrytis]
MGILFEETLSSNPTIQIATDDDNELGLMAVRIANAAAFPMVLKAALELGVFDTLYAASVFLSPSEIASRLPTAPRNPEAPALLDRMLRLLASYSMVKCGTDQAGKGERVYRAEPICRFFLKDNIQDIGSLASQVIVNFDSVFLNTWAQLKDVVLEGGDAFGRAHGGMKLFDYMGTNERFSKLFNQTGFTIAVVKKALEVYQGFNGVNVLVDVGGGVGNTLGVVTSKYPNIKGINFDLTCALAQAPSYPGVEHIAGDMFVDVPTGDAMILKRILHDWTDEDCVKILKNCWKSLPENGKVIVIELVTPDSAESGDINSNIAFDMDMLMFTQCSGGKERSRAEFEALAAESGFTHCKFVCQAYHCWVIEAQLKDVVLEGGNAFGRAHGGMKLFDYMGTDERFSKLFNQTGFTIAVVKKALEVYEGFKDVKVLVDVGGGVGNTLGVVTSKYPHIKGINFDLTCALAQAPSYHGVEHVAGDMFVDVPTGDAMILKRILHDWTDEDCVKILKNCWKSLPENGKVVVIELVTPDDAENGDINANIAFDMDMLMFTQCSGGKERSRAEFEALAAASGFYHCKFVCQAYHCWIIEFCK